MASWVTTPMGKLAKRKLVRGKYTGLRKRGKKQQLSNYKQSQDIVKRKKRRVNKGKKKKLVRKSR